MVHFKVGQFNRILQISSFSEKLARSGDTRPTVPQNHKPLSSRPLSAGLMDLLPPLPWLTSPTSFTSLAPVGIRSVTPVTLGDSDKVPLLTPLHIHLQDVDVQGGPQFPLPLVSPVSRGCSFFDELSLRWGVLSRSGQQW